MADSVSVLRRWSLKFHPLLDAVAHLAKIRGWPYLAAWAHRITGGMLLLYVFLHIYTLSSLSDPARFDDAVKRFREIDRQVMEELDELERSLS